MASRIFLTAYAIIAWLALSNPVHAAIDKIIGGDAIHQGETRRITLIRDGIDFSSSVVPSDARIGVRFLSKKGPAQLKPKGQITLEIAVPINFPAPSNFSLTVNIAPNAFYPLGGKETVGLNVSLYSDYPRETARRPFFHFAPLWGWMNDPSGLVYVNGTYHLYYQAIPFSRNFEATQVNWGHAVSSDLIHWSQRRDPVFKPPMVEIGDDWDQRWSPFTGSAVVFGGAAASQPPCQCSTGLCVASIFTKYIGFYQDQWVATSCNGGETFKEPESALFNVPPKLHFRDPKVFLHGGKWIMVLAAGDKVELYGSSNLKQWSHLSSSSFVRIYPNFAVLGPFVETADLFPITFPVRDSKTNQLRNETKWVLLYGEGYIPPLVCEKIKRVSGLPVFDPLADQLKAECTKSRYVPSRTWYIVGDFNGTNFTVQSQPRPLDFGPDFYAPQTWFNAPGGRRILAGWQNNWQYAHKIGASPWRGQLSIPRELGLIKDESGSYWLTQAPVAEITRLRNPTRHLQFSDVALTNNSPPQLQNLRSTAYDAEIALAFDEADNRSPSEVQIHVGAANGEVVILGLRRLTPTTAQVSLTRNLEPGRQSPSTVWSATVPLTTRSLLETVQSVRTGDLKLGNKMTQAPPTTLSPSTKTILNLRILVDKNSIEVFAGEGRVVLSGLFFPSLNPSAATLRIYATQGNAKLLKFDLYAFN